MDCRRAASRSTAVAPVGRPAASEVSAGQPHGNGVLASLPAPARSRTVRPMALTMLGHMFSALPQLRVQPTQKRIRVLAGNVLVADTTRAMLVWEPRRIVAQYAVPLDDLRVAYDSFTGAAPEQMASVRMGDRP